MRGLVVVCTLCLTLLAGRVGDSPATTQCHPTTKTVILRANLDRDRRREEVSVTNTSCAHDYALGVDDSCGNQTRFHWLRGVGRRRNEQIVEANARPDGRELFYVLERGTHRFPDLGTAALVHLAPLARSRCPFPRFLFLYRADEPLLPPPSGYELARFDVSLTELSSRYQGKEIRLRETFSGTGSEKQRTILLRYSPRADRYVIYSPKL